MDNQLQDDKAKVILAKLEEIDNQFRIMASEIDDQFVKIDNKLESFSDYYLKVKKEILQINGRHIVS